MFACGILLLDVAASCPCRRCGLAGSRTAGCRRCCHDPVVLDQLDHLGGQQPALTHLDALTDVTFWPTRWCSAKWHGRAESRCAARSQRIMSLCLAAHEFVDAGAAPPQPVRPAAVQLVVHDDVVHAVQAEVVQPGQHRPRSPPTSRNSSRLLLPSGEYLT